MKKKLFILILILTFSCKKNEVKHPETKNNEVINKEKLNDELQKIGNLYKPEKFELKENKIEAESIKENYTITLTNSNLLDTDLKNIKTHCEKIAIIYYTFLVRSIKSFNYDKIIVKIVHRNGTIYSCNYSEKEIREIKNKL